MIGVNPDSFAVHEIGRYGGGMQGRYFLIFIAIAALAPSAAFAGEVVKRLPCPRGEQLQQQRQQLIQSQRAKPHGCPVTRPIPPVVDPTPMFLL